MAKFTLEQDYDRSFTARYAALDVVEQKDSRVEVADASGNTIIYSGTGLSVQGNVLTGGTVKEVEFIGANGEEWLTISDAEFRAKDIPQATVAAGFTFYEKGNDTFVGSAHGDQISLSENSGNDRILGMAGDDFIYASDGKNMINGGGGTDTLYYALASFATDPGTDGVKVDLAKGTAVNPWGKVDKISAIEEVAGTKFADTFIGSKRDDAFYGFQGNDVYSGGKGDDTFGFNQGSGSDTIKDFGKGNDTILISHPSFDDFHDILPVISGDEKNTYINLGNGDVLTLLNFKDIAETDFVFQTGDG